MSRSVADRNPGNRVTVDADSANLATLRAHVASLARASGAPVEIVEQLELVVSELATNVMQHSDAAEVTVAFERMDEGWVVDVSDADGLEQYGVPTMADPAALSGRGLFLVHAVMDEVDLVEIDGSRHIRCLKLTG